VTAVALRDKRMASALTYVEIACIERESFDEVLEEFPLTKEKVQSAAMKIAIQRALVVVSEFVKVSRSEAHSNPILSSLMAESRLSGRGGIDAALIIPMITGMPVREVDDEYENDMIDGDMNTPRPGSAGGELAAITQRLEKNEEVQRQLNSKVDHMQHTLENLVELVRADIKRSI